MEWQTDPVFAVSRSTGPDPEADSVVHFAASLFVDGAEAPLVPATWMRPPGNTDGLLLPRSNSLEWTADDLLELPASRERFPECLTSLSGRFVVLAEGRDDFLARWRVHGEGEPPVVLDLESLAAFLHPRRGGKSFASLYSAFTNEECPAVPQPADVQRLCAEFCRAHYERPAALRRLFARAFDDLIATGQGGDAPTLDWLEGVRRLLDRPSRYARGFEDGLLTSDLDEAPLDPDRALAEIEPAFATEYRATFAAHDPLPARCEEPQGLNEFGHKRLEAFFDALPAEFAGADGATPPPERPGQRALAHAVEQTFAKHCFLLADAPTGTGKTLGYLAPLLLWARQHNVRTGLSTYTRALQEQAFFREIPRALRILQAAGVPAAQLPRVSLHKGRANYLCGRALVDSMPEAGDGSLGARASWLRLALYYCEDPTGDLDGFGETSGLPFENPAKARRQARSGINAVRALPQCCVGKAALRCAAGVRTLRSERSHLVVTNHAFVLARPEYFSHVVFDECDHLHEVTLSARSFDIDLDEVTRLAQDLLQGRGRDRAPFERLARFLSRLPLGDIDQSLREHAEIGAKAAAALDAAAHEVTRELRLFRDWRKENGGNLTPEERAFLLHDYLETGRGEGLGTGLKQLRQAVDDVDSRLRSIIEQLGDLPQRGARRIRWALRRPLELLDHWREGLDRWLGGEEGESDFSEDLHYEVSFEQRRRPMLVLKWLLPQKWLGEVYYPSLLSAALVSATARIKSGFAPMKGYLGLDIAEQGTAEAPGRTVLEFSGPPTFDTRAALVCVPEDAPAYGYAGAALETWMNYLEDFLLFLAERTRGRILGLFTNRMTLQRVGERLAPAFHARGIPLFWQGMPGLGKEEIMERFRMRVDSVLLGLDTFWYGVDFPGETCEYVVVTKLPYGQLDDYLHAQRARMGFGPHRNRIYLPKALAMFRQGCGRLLRNEDDRGVVFILDRRVLEKRHADFLAELPGGQEEFEEPNVLVGDSDSCLHEAFSHMNLWPELQRLGWTGSFNEGRLAMRAEETTP